ncbi:MAG TPA: ELWxxDGT repeat protein [Thermoanaerobaculia bacterium]|nr:ELWxxDGT repeat protein [Thermoanaerobaculia bacterium]
MKSLAACALLALVALLAIPAAALEPYLVKDINPVPRPADSTPEGLVAFGGAVLFSANDGIDGTGLWRSDGTAAGTYELTDCQEDLCYGKPQPFVVTERLYFFLFPTVTASGYQSLFVSDGTPGGTFPLTGAGVRIQGRGAWSASQGVLYFLAEDEEHGVELWRSDGTVAGTYLVSDVRPGPAGSAISGLVEYRGLVWFGADDGQRGGALWRTDGTAAGTVLALDPVPSSSAHPAPHLFRVLGSRLTFSVPASSGYDRLWAGDGTAKKTAPVTPGPMRTWSSAIRGNRLYFVAEDKKGQELWVSDGTARGTRALTSFRKPDPFFSSSAELPLPFLGNLANRFVFRANDGSHGAELWITDGTPKGTRLLRDICPGPCHGAGEVWHGLNGQLYFTANEPTHGSELWSTDGTAVGTRLVRDLCPGSCGSNAFAPFPLGNRLLFVADDGQAGDEIWSTDGTAAGTVQISAFEPDHVWSRFHGAVAGGQLFFTAKEALYGDELWRTDGTPAGTHLVRDLNPADIGGSHPSAMRALGDRAIFFAYDGGLGLWQSDGSGPGTTKIRAFEPGEVDDFSPRQETDVAGGRLFFFLRQGSGAVLWRTDGTEAGTFRLTGAPACCGSLMVRAVGNLAFFAAREQDQGTELWASDGTTEGTRRVRDIEPGFSGAEPRELTAFQGKLYFSAGNLDSRRELWTSDGTEAGTVQVKEIHPHSTADPTLLTVHAGRLWFFADDGEHGSELWSSDGTEAGTRLEVELAPGPDSFDAKLMVSLGGKLVVSGYSRAESAAGLWVTDGTPAGTRKISERPAADGRDRTVFQGRLYYSLWDGIYDILWVTDGTEDGTRPLLDREGMEIQDAGPFAALGGRLFFKIRTFGVPLWVTDGTSAGTFPLLPVTVPGTNAPDDLVRAGDRVFFPNYDPLTGVELWAVP